MNERVRNLLRLEHLFGLIEASYEDLSDWHCRNILESLLEVIDLLSRSDLKTELIKELEKHSTMLNSLKDNPAVDQHRLKAINEQISELLERLRDSNYQPGNELKHDELVTSVKQRISIPGGTCNFDLPRFHFWLNQPFHIRKQDLLNWSRDLEPIKNASLLTLDMIRNSSNPTMEIATDGFFQKPIESNLACQLISVLLPASSKYFPEVSGGKHRFTIRFLTGSSTSDRAVQADRDIEFELHCCIL